MSTTVRTNIADGGVDAAVHAAAPNDTAGRVTVCTAWQFKATRYSEVSDQDLRTEVGKSYARELIEKGYGYRFCICDDPPDQKKADWEAVLTAEAKNLNASAPPAQVLTASDLAAWASRFPAIAGNIFNRPMGTARHWRAWEISETQFTPQYSLPEGWAPYLSAIQDQIDFNKETEDPILTVQGAAGVGKTRLAFEAVRQIPGASELVILADDEDRAVEVARWLVNHGEMAAILIADECPVDGREKLRKILRGSESRIRAVAIDNTGEPTPGGAPGIWLDKIGVRSVEEILKQNYGPIPAERRRAYADLSGGYVRLAADLCRHDQQMYSAGTLAPAISHLDDYYRSRLSEDERRVVEAVSLLQRVGCDEDVAEELNQLSALTDVNPQTVRETAQRLKNSPGFLARTPRYVYVTPQIIAEIAFRHAWRRWAQANQTSFLDRFPQSLLKSFENRVRGLMDQEVRSFVSAHFRDRVANFTPSDLADGNRVSQLLSLLETEPSSYLPQLERLVRESTQDELLAHGATLFDGRGTRRGIVWAAERLAAFQEYFPAAEYILRRLALAESEPRIGNNATGIWRQLFRVWLSGTSVPFLERFKIYRSMLFSAEAAERDLALGALDHLWDTHVSRMGSPSVIGGRIPPADWQPATYGEIAGCFSAGFDLLREMLAAGSTLADSAWSYLIRHLRTLLSYRELNRLQSLLGGFPLPQPLLGPWLEQVEDFLQYECGDPANAEDDLRAYCEEVRAWKDQIRPTDFAGRLRAIVGKDVWHHGIREDIWKAGSELDPIAEELTATPGLLDESLDYLCSPEARSAVSLGTAIGRRDTGGVFLVRILATARQSRSTALLRGYVAGLLTASPEQAVRVNQILDALETEDAPIAVEMILGALELTAPATRIVRMVRAGRLSFETMQFLLYGGTLQQISTKQFWDLLGVFDDPNAPPEALKIASDIIGSRLRAAFPEASTANEDPETVKRILRILEFGATVENRGDFWWADALAKLAVEAPAEVARVAALAIGGEDYEKRHRGAAILAKLAESKPAIVMAEIGPRILDPKSGWNWLAGSFKEIFAAFPAEVVMEWLDEVGVAGARRIARHLPSPFTDKEGRPVVPELTERVLSKYGDDDGVFGDFCAGRHDLEVSCGDPADTHEGYARAAEPFRNHPVPAVRRWAAEEVASNLSWAARRRKETEDEHFEP